MGYQIHGSELLLCFIMIDFHRIDDVRITSLTCLNIGP